MPAEKLMRFRFVHAADLHLDTPFEGISQVAPGVAERLRDASLDAFDALVQLAIEQEAAFLLLAGDIYDGAERGVRAQLRFLRGLERLAEYRIRAFIVHGNHDPIDGWSAIRRWPEGVTVFGADGVRSIAVERDGARLATVYGISYGRREVTENLSLLYRKEMVAGLHIGLLHCSVGASADHGAYSPCSVQDLVGSGMDYWAIGHIHQRQRLGEGSPWIVYPGNLQGRSLKPSEQGAKGAVVVEVEGDLVRRVEFVPLDRVRFTSLRIDIAGVDDLPGLQNALLSGLDLLQRENQGRSLLVRAILEGRGPVHRDLGHPNAADDLLRDLRREVEGDCTTTWWEGIRDETRGEIDREILRRREDLSAELIRRSEELSSDPQRLSDFIQGCLGVSRRGALQRWLRDVVLPSDRELLDQAEELALEFLSGEGRG